MIRRSEADWEYAWELRESDTGDFFDRGLPQLNERQALALGDLRAIEENRASPDEPPLVVRVVRRRRAGEWEASDD